MEMYIALNIEIVLFTAKKAMRQYIDKLRYR